MRRFLHDNGLSVALFVLFLVSLIGQARHSVANATRLERTYRGMLERGNMRVEEELKR